MGNNPQRAARRSVPFLALLLTTACRQQSVQVLHVIDRAARALTNAAWQDHLSASSPSRIARSTLLRLFAQEGGLKRSSKSGRLFLELALLPDLLGRSIPSWELEISKWTCLQQHCAPVQENLGLPSSECNSKLN